MSPSDHQHTTAHEDLLGTIVDKITDQLNHGETPDIEHYEFEHPEIANLLRDLFPSIRAMKRDASSLDDSPEYDPRPNLLETRELGDYRIVREIGRGGMAVVYEAQHETLRRRVALKVLMAHSGEHYRQRFEREARSVASLHHTNIVPVYESGEADGVLFIAMQYIEGQSLDKFLSRSESTARREHSPTLASPAPPFSDRKTHPDLEVATSSTPQKNANGIWPDRHPAGCDNPISSARSDVRYVRVIARMGADVADALTYAHRHGVLHRDIKPSNLILDDGGSIWVSDFGLAKTEEDNLTRSGDIIGTVRYMPPERFQGQCDARSDVYSLGVTLYELLTGRPAFSENDRVVLMRDIAESDPPRPRTINAAIPADLETIVLKAISRDPARRYTDASTLQADLLRFLDDKPIEARRATLVEHAWRWSRRNAALATALGLLALCFITGFAGIAWQWRRAEDHLIEARHNLHEANRQHELATASSLDADRQREQVEMFLDRAHKVVEDFSKIFNEQIADGSNIDPAQRKMMATAIVYYQDYLSMYGDDPRREQELAEAYKSVGWLRSKVGSKETAITDYQRAISIYQRLLKGNSDAIELQRAISAARIGLAHHQIGLKRLNDGVATLQKIIAELEPLVQRHAGDSELESTLRSAYHNLGYARTEQDQLEQARIYLDKALTIEQRSIGDQPDIRRVKLGISRGYYFQRSGQPDKALKTYQQSLAISNQLSDAEPNSRSYRDSVAWSHNKIGDAYRELRRHSDAVEQYKTAIAIQEVIVSSEPAVVNYKEHLANSYANLGESYFTLEQYANAVDALLKAVAQEQDLCDRTDNDPSRTAALASAMWGLTRAYRDSKQPDLALEWCRRAIEQLKYKERAGDDVGYASARAGRALGLARILAQLERTDEARESFQESLRWRRRAIDASSESRRVSELESLRIHYGYLAHFESDQGRLAAAEAAAQQYKNHDGDGPDRLFLVAALYGRFANTVSQHRSAWTDQRRESESQRYIARSLEILTEAFDAGFRQFKRLEADSRFAMVRRTEEYRLLLSEQHSR